MLRKIDRTRPSNLSRGQGLTEYLLLLALIAIGVITIVATFGDTIKQIFTGANTKMAAKPLDAVK